MKRLVVITQKVDIKDDLLGFFVGWLREFAKHFDRVDVITLAKGEYDLPSNVTVYSLGKEKGASKVSQLLNYYKLLFNLVPGSVGVFAHMSPVFAITTWPVTTVFRKKLVLWYLHRSVTLKLKLALFLSSRVVTSTKESLRIKSKKIFEVGHGIDASKFVAQRDWPGRDGQPLRILSVGRISPIKDYETLIRAAGILEKKNIRFFVKIVGRPVMPPDIEYHNRLHRLVAELHLGDSVQFAGLVPYSDIAEQYRNSDLVIGLAPTGGIDKVVLEAMASGALVLTANRAFARYLGPYAGKFVFEHGSAQDLADHIVGLASWSVSEKSSASQEMVRSVIEHHDLKKATHRIAQLFS